MLVGIIAVMVDVENENAAESEMESFFKDMHPITSTPPSQKNFDCMPVCVSETSKIVRRLHVQ